jgi:hypothetical protein
VHKRKESPQQYLFLVFDDSGLEHGKFTTINVFVSQAHIS